MLREGNRQRLALIGANGMLAAMVRRVAPKQYDLIPFDLPEFDLTAGTQVLDALHKIRPHLIINCAAYTNVDGCETNEETATRVNGLGPGCLAEAASDIGATLVHISTDYVFDGTKNRPYTEEDAPHPQSAYGRSKLIGEQAILKSGLEKYFIVRTSWLYGPGGKNFVETIVRLAKEREELTIVDDQVGTPTYTGDLAQALFSLVRTESYGIYHFSNEGLCSWYGFSREIVSQLARKGEAVEVRRILPIKTADYPLPATRPAYSVFSKEKYKQATGAAVPEWQEGLAQYFALRDESA